MWPSKPRLRPLPQASCPSESNGDYEASCCCPPYDDFDAGTSSNSVRQITQTHCADLHNGTFRVPRLLPSADPMQALLRANQKIGVGCQGIGELSWWR